MRKTKKWLKPAAALMCVTAMVAACGGGGDKDDKKSEEATTSEKASGDATDEETSKEAPAPIELPDLSGKTLNVASDWSGDEQANFEAVLAEFTEKTGAKVTYTSLGNNVATALGTQIEGGSPPNVALVPQPGLLVKLANDGAIKPVSDDVLETVKANFAQTWVDLGSVDGNTYGVWFKAANKSTMWYNVELYENAGASVPETWDDFISTLQLISDSGTPGLVVGADVGWPLTDWFENVYLRTAGAEMYDKLTNHEIPWTDDSVKEALEVLSQLFGNDALLASGGAQRSFPDSVTDVFGPEPKGATVYEGDFVAGVISGNTDAKVGEDAKFYPFPSVNGSAPAVVGGGNAAVAFDDDEATMALMKFLASPEAANVWIPKGGFTSPNKNADLELYPDEISLEVAKNLVEAETFRFDMSDLAPSAFGGTEGTGMWQAMIDFYENPTDIDGAMQKLEDYAVKAYADK